MKEIDEKLYRIILRFISRRVSSPTDVQDLTQSVFMRALARSEHIPEGRELAYLITCARRMVIDYYRRRQASREVLVPEVDETVAGSAPADPDEERAVIASWMPDEVAALPAIYREPLELFGMEGVLTSEIANRLGLSEGAVRIRLYRARRLIRDRLEACCRFVRDAAGRVIGWEKRSIALCCEQ